jgi:hypothetical protein
MGLPSLKVEVQRYQNESFEAITNAQSNESGYPRLICALFGGSVNRTKSIVMILLVTSTVLVSYQNCGVEPPESMYDIRQAYKLPYEVSVDQIAYMSCSEQGGIPNEPDVYFSLRVGAYGSAAGLRLSDDFLYETRSDTSSSRALKLSEEVVSLNHRLMFSVRQQSDLRVSYMNSGTTLGIEAQDYDFVFGNLGSSEMSASLMALDTDEYMNYWAPGGIESDAYMQGTMVFDAAESVAQDMRNFLEKNGGLITLGYSSPINTGALLTRALYATNQDDDGDGRNDDSDDDIAPTNEAYGVGLKVSFKVANPANWGYTLSAYNNTPHPNMPKRVLATVYEYDLSAPQQVKSTWSCPTALQLRVVAPADKDLNDPYPFSSARKLCPDAADPTNPTDLANFQLARRSLPVSHWKINWARKCVVPKFYTKGSCYGIDDSFTPTASRSVAYDFTRSRADTSNPNNYCDPATGRACLHFVSICLRP